MGFIVVLLIIAGVLWSHSILAALCLIILSIVIIFKKQYYKWCFVFMSMFLLSYYFYHTYDYKRERLPFDYEINQSAVTTIRILDDYQIDGNLLTGTMTTRDGEFQFFYKIKNEIEKHQLQTKHLSFLQCDAQVTRQHVLPNTNFSGFHFDTFLYHHHKWGSVKLSNVNWQQCTPSELSFIEWIKAYRKSLALTMSRTNIEHTGYFIALTLGDTSFLSKAEMDRLKSLGIYHLYAISGSHVALLSVQLFYCLRRMHVPLILCTCILIFLLPLYMIFTGGQPSVFRSTIFILLILLYPKRVVQISDLLSLTFIINLLYEPFSIYDVGFQLSYIICYSFVFILPIYREYSNLFQFFLVNFISQLVTIPILLFHFNNNYFIGLMTNLFFIPLFSFFIFPVCTFGLLLMMFNIPVDWITPLINIAFSINEMLTTIFMQLPRFEMVVGQQHILLYLLLFIVLMLVFSTKKLKRGISIILMMLLIVVSGKQANDSVHFLDIGQGDAMILELENKVMMIDTGGKPDFSEQWEKRHNAQTISDKVTIPFLKHRGIKKVDTLILTHPDADHFGETSYLIQQDMIYSIIFNPRAHGSEKYQQVIQLAREKHIPLIDVNLLITHDDMQFVQSKGLNNTKKSSLKFLTVGPTGEENNDSIIVFLEYGKKGRNILFLADLGKDYEAEILKQIKAPIDIVKIGHHGSRTSTSENLLARQPKVGIISAGRNNRFQHPHNETMDALHNAGVQVLNTQTEGRITIDLEEGKILTQYQSLMNK
ncbi:DNA internalization-related competence protein ComEC/Rec2 [Macrococcus capreoli]|uniref:DNA internalization-related competence protein ComEC/Rec2 n=1 Tax=Macrococcus capreoli TaxID=2982690 RepID=UPI003EE77FB0